MVRPSLLAEFYRESIEDNLSQIQYLSRNIGEMNRIRETNCDDWEMIEICRHIIFLEGQILEDLRKEVEHDRREIAKIKKGRPAESPSGV